MHDIRVRSALMSSYKPVVGAGMLTYPNQGRDFSNMADIESMRQAADEANAFLQELKGKTKAAIQANDATMAPLFNKLVKLTSPVVTGLYARVDRAEKAELNKGAKKLVRDEWEKTKADRSSGGDSSTSPQ